MGYTQVHICTVLGLKAPAVTVEVHLSNGLPNFALVGLADTEVREARERVRSAILNSGLDFPSNKRIIVNLAPADLPKESGRFDLLIAVGILAASEQIDAQALQLHVFASELSLSGELRPVRGALAMALGLQANKHKLAWVLPPHSAEEAALQPDAVFSVPCICATWCRRLPCRASIRRQTTAAGRASCQACRRRPPAQTICRTYTTCAVRPHPSARWKSRQPAAIVC